MDVKKSPPDIGKSIANTVDRVVRLASATGWQPWFNEWPNDVHHYALVIESMDDVNRLIAKLAAVKGDLNQIRLACQIEPRSLGFVTSMPDGNGIPLMFIIGDQKQIDIRF